MRRCFVSMLLALLLGVCGTASAQPVPTRPKTVEGYFLLLPQKYFVRPTSVSQRRAWLRSDDSVLDIKNDFLEAGDYSRSVRVALFRHQGRILVAVTDFYAPDASSNFSLLRYEGGSWKNVTRSLLPIAYNPRMSYDLPRRGTTIRVRPSDGDTTRNNYNLLWRGGKFQLQRL